MPHVGPVAQLGVDQRDLFETLAEVGVERVNFCFAEMIGNRQMLRERQIGHMQHERFMFDQRGFNGRQRFWQNYVGRIEIKYLGANGGAERADVER